MMKAAETSNESIAVEKATDDLSPIEITKSNGQVSPMQIDNPLAEDASLRTETVGPEGAAKAADTGLSPPKTEADSHMSSDAKKRKLEETLDDEEDSTPVRKKGVAAIKPE